MGGYVCFPGGMMAALLSKPLMLVNADAALLMSNKALLPVADRVAFGFDGDAAARTKNAVVTGNPVRAEIEALPEPAARYAGRSGPLRLLVVGGSLGAQVLNETLPAALALLAPGERPLVTHQTGAAEADAVRAAYAAAGIAAEVLPFIDDMPQRLAACDLMVCRAGAITVSELCAAGVPAILVPLVVSTTAHQRDNAAWMAGRQAARAPAAGRADGRRRWPIRCGGWTAPHCWRWPSARVHWHARRPRRASPTRSRGWCAHESRQPAHPRRRARAGADEGRAAHRGGGMKHAIKHIHFVGVGGAGMSAIAEDRCTTWATACRAPTARPARSRAGWPAWASASSSATTPRTSPARRRWSLPPRWPPTIPRCWPRARSASRWCRAR